MRLFRKIVPKEEMVSYEEGEGDKEKFSSGERDENRKHKKPGEYRHGKEERRRRNQKVLGNKGELLVYNLLCKRVGKENVFPRSEAFVELEILKPGQAVSGEYDLSYREKDGIEYFVEVKTGDGKNFIFSPGELQCAKENAEKYKVILVYDVEKEEPKCIELPKRFWEDSHFRKKEIVERIEFEVVGKVM